MFSPAAVFSATLRVVMVSAKAGWWLTTRAASTAARVATADLPEPCGSV